MENYEHKKTKLFFLQLFIFCKITLVTISL